MSENEAQKEGEDPETASPDSEDSGPLILTDRDLKIFQMIHEHKYLAQSHIRMAFFHGNSIPAKACHRRRVRLTEAGYLEQFFAIKKKLHIYFLTQKAHDELKVSGLDRGLPLYERTPNFDYAMDHDLKTTTVRIMFQRLGLCNWMSERMIRERALLRLTPDGILTVGRLRIAVEFENRVSKGKERYVELFKRYGGSGEFKLLFVVYDGDARDSLLSYDYDARRVWFASYRELVLDPKTARFENARSSVMLGELLHLPWQSHPKEKNPSS